MERSLRVLDGACAVFDAKEGVEPQSETVWRQADKYGVPRICFVNKMDKLGADFYFTVKTMVDRLGATPLVPQLPIGQESAFTGVVDLLRMKALMWRGETQKGEDYTVEDIPADLQEKAEEYRHALVETVAESNDELMEKYLEGEELTIDELKGRHPRADDFGHGQPGHLRHGVQNKGVQPMLDAVVDFLPSPLEVPRWSATSRTTGGRGRPALRRRRALRGAGLQGRRAPFFGRLTYVRVYSGAVTPGTQVLNATRGKKERIGKLFQMHSNKENPVDKASAGHIYAFIGLKDTTTGDTLCDIAAPVVPRVDDLPEPVISVAIEPKTKGDQEKLGTAIQKLAEEDPTFQVQQDEETGQTIIKGWASSTSTSSSTGCAASSRSRPTSAKPQVAYRETIRRTVEKVDYTHKKQTGGSGQYAKVQVTIEPMDTAEGAMYEFDNKVTGGRIPREYIPSVDQGIQDAMQYGVLAGYPLVGIKATLLDGAYHDVDSSEMAFKIAGSMVLRSRCDAPTRCSSSR